MARYNNLKIDETLLLLKGDKGDKGDKGEDGKDLYLGETDETAYAGSKGAQNAKDIETLKQIVVQNGVTSVVEVEQAYTSRETANGENIVDGQFAVVKEIKGKTVVDESTGTLKHAYINSIKSTGRNLIPYPYTDTPTNGNTVTKYGVTFTDNGDGSITVKGTATGGNAYFYLTSALAMSVGSYYMSGDGADIRATLTNESGDVKWVHTGVNTLDEVKYATCYIVVLEGTTADYTVYPMLNYGTTALPYEPYTEDIYQLPKTLELPKWDRFNAQTGELTKGTGSYEFTGDETFITWSGANGYIGAYVINPFDYDYSSGSDIRGVCNYYPVRSTLTQGVTAVSLRQVGDVSQVHFQDDSISSAEAWKAHIAELYASGNPLTVAYKSATPTTETIVNVPKSYKVHNHGNETVQGDGVTITNEYFKLTEV